MPNQKNKNLVKELQEKVSKSKSVIFADYHGLSAQAVTELRTKLSEAGAEANVSKNTLLKIALKEEKIGSDEADKKLVGPTMTIFSFEDAVAGVKALFDFADEHEDLPAVKGGIVDGEYTSYEKLEILSQLPGRQELLGKVANAMNSPISGLVNSLGGIQRNFVYVLSAIADKKEE